MAEGGEEDELTQKGCTEKRRELGMGGGSRASKRPRGGGGDTEQVWTYKPGR